MVVLLDSRTVGAADKAGGKGEVATRLMADSLQYLELQHRVSTVYSFPSVSPVN